MAKEVLNLRGRPRVQTFNTEPSMTVQSDKHLADINNILKGYAATGGQSLDEAKLTFADVSTFGDFHDVMIQVKEAETAFMKLPSKVREIFDHSVEIWLDSSHDKDKYDALVAAGFIKRKESAIEDAGAGDPVAVGGSGSPEAAAGSGEGGGAASPS